jgi:hypothetical protein
MKFVSPLPLDKQVLHSNSACPDTLFNLGKAEGSIDAGQMIKPALARGLQLVGATTRTYTTCNDFHAIFTPSQLVEDEYRKTIGKDAALERRFQPVQIEEPTVESTISILRGLKSRYEVHHGVEISDGALVTGCISISRALLRITETTVPQLQSIVRDTSRIVFCQTRQLTWLTKRHPHSVSHKNRSQMNSKPSTARL